MTGRWTISSGFTGNGGSAGTELEAQPACRGIGQGVAVHHEEQGFGLHVTLRGVKEALVNVLAGPPGILHQVETLPILIHGRAGDMHQVIIGGPVVVKPLLPQFLGNLPLLPRGGEIIEQFLLFTFL